MLRKTRRIRDGAARIVPATHPLDSWTASGFGAAISGPWDVISFHEQSALMKATSLMQVSWRARRD